MACTQIEGLHGDDQWHSGQRHAERHRGGRHHQWAINGFQHGLDKINLADLLSDFGIAPADAFSGGFVTFGTIGTNTLVQFDSDGTAGGAASPLLLATVNNAVVTQSDIAVT